MKACATREHAMKEPFYEGEVKFRGSRLYTKVGWQFIMPYWKLGNMYIGWT